VHTSAQPQRHDECPARGELGGPGTGDVPHAGGHQDPVERGPVGGAQPAIAGAYLDIGRRAGGNAGDGEVRLGGQRDGRVDVDGGHFPTGANQVGEQSGVVAGSGANLQHVVARLRVELGSIIAMMLGWLDELVTVPPGPTWIVTASSW
jgi:hypothetical protein